MKAFLGVLAVVLALPAWASDIVGHVVGDSVTFINGTMTAQEVVVRSADSGADVPYSCPVESGSSFCEPWSKMWLRTCDQVHVASSTDGVTTTSTQICAEGLGAGILATRSDADLGLELQSIECLTAPGSLPIGGEGQCAEPDCDGGAGSGEPLDDGRG